MIHRIQNMKLIQTGLLLIVLLSSFCQIAFASTEYRLSKGQTLYVPVYSKTLAPLESTDIYIPEEGTTGGTGANFIVKWNSQKEVNVPIIESVMIGMKSGQGISFVSPGQEIKDSAR